MTRDIVLIYVCVIAITNVEIKGAMSKLGIPNENDAKAVDVRQELDLKVSTTISIGSIYQNH